MKYLETVTNFFVSPHGEWDEGGAFKQVVEGEEYDLQYEEQQLPENQEKVCVHGEWINEDEYTGSEDGYNQEIEISDLKLVTDEQAAEYEKIIAAYKQL